MSFLDHLYLNGNINFKEYPDYTTQKDINNLTKDIQYWIGKLEYDEDKEEIVGVSDLESEVSNIDDIRSGEDAVWSLEQVVDEFESFYNKVEKYFIDREDFDALEELEIWEYKRPSSFDIDKDLADRLSEYSMFWRCNGLRLVSKTQPFVSISLHKPSYTYGKYGSTWIASTPKLKSSLQIHCTQHQKNVHCLNWRQGKQTHLENFKMTKHNKKIHIAINGVAVCGAPHYNRSALVREDVTCKVCKRSLEYKKLKSRKQVRIKK